MATVGRINVFLGADTAAFTSKLDRARRDLSRNSTRMNRSLALVDRGFKRAGKSAALFAKSQLGLRSIIGIVAGGAGLGLLLKRSLDTADSIAKMSDATGISTTAIQQYRFALDQSGVAIEATDKGLKKFTRNMGELARSSSETQTSLKDLDPALLKNLRSLDSVEDQLKAAFRALAGYGNQSKRAAVAAALFGRAGGDMAVGVKNGAAAFENLQQRALDLGIVLRGSLLAGAVDTKDALAEMTQQIDTNTTRAMLNLAPLITGLTGLFADLTSGIVAAGGAVGSAFAPSLEQQLASLEARLVTLKAAGEVPAGQLFASSAKGSAGRRGRLLGGTPGSGTQRQTRTRTSLVSAPVDPITAVERQIAKIRELIALQEKASTPPVVEPPGEQIGFVPKAKDLDAAFAAMTRVAEQRRRDADAARQNLDMIFTTIQTNEERYRAELDFLDKTRASLEQTKQLTAKNQAILERGAEAAKKRFQEMTAVAGQARAAMDPMIQAGERMAWTFDNALEDALRGNIRTWEDLRRVAVDALQDIINQTIRLLAIKGGASGQESVGGLIAKLLVSGIGALSGGLGKGVSPTGSDILGTPFVHGGRPPIGQVALVGERGPELFIPDVRGTIIPNSDLRDGGGGRGSTPIINQYVTTPDANSFRANSRQLARLAKQQFQF